MSAIRSLIETLPPAEKEKLLRELTETASTPRPGDVLAKVIQLIPKGRDWTVAEVKTRIGQEGGRASAKEIYNAIGYLARKGRVTRIGYGRYRVDGVEVHTSDDLGGESARHEDTYRVDRGSE